MRACVQKVRSAAVTIDGQKISEIGSGLLVLLAIHTKDTSQQINWMVDKLLHLRIFEDENKKMNLHLLDTQKEILIISQFTLYADCSKGRRPSFIQSAPIDLAKKIYTNFIQEFKNKYTKVKTGIFQANMDIHLINQGPMTFIIDSKEN